jgi:hypothetical protein
LTRKLLHKKSQIAIKEKKLTNKWIVPTSVLAFLFGAFIFADQLSGPLSGQIIATSAAISVAALGIWAYFKKSN